MGIALYFVFAALLACFIHEGGHYIAGRLFGHNIAFKLEWGLLFGSQIIPRGVWTMPKIERWKQKVIAIAGFGIEVGAIPIVYQTDFEFAIAYWSVVVLHLLFYPIYSSEFNDFKWFRDEPE